MKFASRAALLAAFAATASAQDFQQCGTSFAKEHNCQGGTITVSAFGSVSDCTLVNCKIAVTSGQATFTNITFTVGSTMDVSNGASVTANGCKLTSMKWTVTDGQSSFANTNTTAGADVTLTATSSKGSITIDKMHMNGKTSIIAADQGNVTLTNTIANTGANITATTKGTANMNNGCRLNGGTALQASNEGKINAQDTTIVSSTDANSKFYATLSGEINVSGGSVISSTIPSTDSKNTWFVDTKGKITVSDSVIRDKVSMVIDDEGSLAIQSCTAPQGLLNTLTANNGGSLTLNNFVSNSTKVVVQGATLSIDNASFGNINTTALSKPLLEIASSKSTIKNLNFHNITCGSNPGCHVEFKTGTVQWTGGNIYTEGIDSVRLVGPNLSGSISGLRMNCSPTKQGTNGEAMLSILSNAGNKFTFEDIILESALAPIAVQNVGEVVFNKISILNVPKCLRTTPPIFVRLGDSKVTLNDFVIRNQIGSSSINMDNAQVTFNNWSYSNASMEGIAISVAKGSKVLVSGSSLSNMTIKNSGFIMVEPDSALELADTLIDNVTLSNSPEFGTAIGNSGNLTLNSATIRRVQAELKTGVVMVSGAKGYLLITGKTTIENNSAKRCGGALFLADNSTVVFDAELLKIQDNSSPKGSVICMKDTFNVSNIIVNKLGAGSIMKGSIFTNTRLMGEAMLNNDLFTKTAALRNSRDLVFSSKPVRLVFAEGDSFGPENGTLKEYSILPSQQLPTFSVKAIDVFGTLSDAENGRTYVEVGELSPVIFINDTLTNAQLIGELSKVLPSGKDYFDDIVINNTASTRTSYNLTIAAISGTMDFNESTVQWPMIYVQVANCDQVTNTNYTDDRGMTRCYQFCPIGSGVRNGFGGLGVVFTLFAVAITYTMKNMGLQEVLKIPSIAERRLSVMMSVLGNLISFLAIAINLDSSSRSCSSWAWLWTIGFFLSMTALATYTVGNVRRRGKAKILRKLAELKEEKNNELLRFYELDVRDEVKIFAAHFVPVLVFLIAWQVAEPTVYKYVMANDCIIPNQCSESTFNSLSSIFRLGALFANLLLIVNYRKVAKNVKAIAFVLVNWLIFEIIAIVLPRVVYYAADVVFAFKCLCVFIPNVVSAVAMLYSNAEEDDFADSSSIGMSTGSSQVSSTSGTGKKNTHTEPLQSNKSSHDHPSEHKSDIGSIRTVDV